MVSDYREINLPSGFKIAAYESLPSTQDTAVEVVRSGDRTTIAVITDFQSSGRGRSGSAWLAPPGSSLLASYILRSPKLQKEDAPKLAFVTAVAVSDAVEQIAAVEIGLKWPNDLLIGGRKVAGLLIETISDANGNTVAIAGIGINVGNMSFPPELVMGATALNLESPERLELTLLEAAVRTELFERFRQLLRVGFAPILRDWRARDVTAGIEYCSTVGGASIQGTAVGVSDTGALMLRLDGGSIVEVVSASALRPV